MLFGYRKTILNKKPGDISLTTVKDKSNWESMYEGTLLGTRFILNTDWGPYFFSSADTQTYHIKVCVV